MKFKKHILLLMLFISGVVSSQIKNDLRQYKVAEHLIKYGIKFNTYFLKNEFKIKDYNEGFTSNNNIDSIILKKVKVCKKKEIFIYTYKYTPTNYEQNHDEYFSINNTKYFIDSILNSDNISLKYYNPYFYFRNSYLFTGKKKDDIIILIEAENRTIYRDKFVKSYFIIKSRNDKNQIFLLYDLDKSKVALPM